MRLLPNSSLGQATRATKGTAQTGEFGNCFDSSYGDLLLVSETGGLGGMTELLFNPT